MTKDRLRRLMQLKHSIGSGRALPDEEEYEALKAEFEAWEPERERDEARGYARSYRQIILTRELTQEVREAAIKPDEQRAPWLKEEVE